MRGAPRDGKKQPRLFPAEAFAGFGPSAFRPPDEPATGRKLRGKRAKRLHRGVRDHAPQTAGVYGMIDDRARIIYIGKAKNLRSRLMSYFRENSRPPKAGKIIDRTRVLVWEQTADEFAALLRELELIQHFRPKFNVQGQPGYQKYHYLCVGKSPAPYVYAAARPTGKELGCYGPMVKRYKSEDAARRLNDWFKLRDCPSTVPLSFSDQGELFDPNRSPGCIRLEIGTCAGPCVGQCSRKEYGAGVRAAKAFLDGRDRTVLRDLKAKMDAAAESFEFEKATAMRDRLQSLEWLDGWLSLLRAARNRNSFVYPLAGHDGREMWYLIHRGRVRAVVVSPRTPDEGVRAAALIAATFDDDPTPALPTDATVDSVLLVSAWFRKQAGEKAKLLTRTEAIAKCATSQAPASS